jgi:hypothetical protein
MAHFDLATTELGLYGKWQILEPNLNKGNKGNLKYIVSWIRNIK